MNAALQDVVLVAAGGMDLIDLVQDSQMAGTCRSMR
jgi:hypothetical protein